MDNNLFYLTNGQGCIEVGCPCNWYVSDGPSLDPDLA